MLNYDLLRSTRHQRVFGETIQSLHEAENHSLLEVIEHVRKARYLTLSFTSGCLMKANSSSWIQDWNCTGHEWLCPGIGSVLCASVSRNELHRLPLFVPESACNWCSFFIMAPDTLSTNVGTFPPSCVGYSEGDADCSGDAGIAWSCLILSWIIVLKIMRLMQQ